MATPANRAVDDRSAAVRLGALLQRYRDALGMTQRELAERLSLERSGVSQFETGARVPSNDVMRRWYRVFGQVADVAHLHTAALSERGHARRARQHQASTEVRPPSPREHQATATLDEIGDDANNTSSASLAAEGADVRRDQFLALTGSTLADLLVSWPRRPARTGLATVQQLELVTASHRRLYHTLSSGELIGAVAGHLRTVLALLRGRPTAPVRQGLAAIACETAGHATSLAHNLGDRAAAERCYALAAATGREANDPALRAYVRGFMSQVRFDEGDIRGAVQLTQGARASGDRSATATTRPWLAGLEAVALAAAGNEADCTTALTESEHALHQARPAEGPGWQYRFDSAAVAALDERLLAAL